MSQVVGSLSPIDMQVSRFSHYVLRTHLFRSLYAKNDVLKEATLYFIVSDKLVLLRSTYPRRAVELLLRSENSPPASPSWFDAKFTLHP